MKQTEWNYRGEAHPMSFTANALFTVYDRYGVGEITDITEITESSEQGFRDLCWIAALLCREAELQRRYMGEDPRIMLTAEELELMLLPSEVPALRSAVAAAMKQGFRRSLDTGEPEEVNAVLLERENAEKKAKTPDFFERVFSRRR